MPIEIVRDPRLSERSGLENLPQAWKEALYTKNGLRFAVALGLPNVRSLGELRGREFLGEIEMIPIYGHKGLLQKPHLIIPIDTTTRVADISEVLRQKNESLTIDEMLKKLIPNCDTALPMIDIMAINNSIPPHMERLISNLIRAKTDDLTVYPRLNWAMVTGRHRIATIDTISFSNPDKPPLSIPAFIDLFQRIGITIKPVSQDVLAQRIKSLAGI